MRIVLATLILASALVAAFAQTTTDPALHHRGDASQNQTAAAGGKQRGTSTLPADASGEYLIDEAGSVVQITIENGRLDGYVSKLVEGLTSTVTYFFDRTTMNGDRLTFTTKEIHGIWYSFDGLIVRGDGQSKQQDGYYRLRGTLMTHDAVQKSQSSSTINLKSTPRRD
ncbi:MAG TPA: hypothetical protein VHT28_08960 [Silvibacterium sp.]|nr:hypothetical protein [Silvibacterium sp.]